MSSSANACYAEAATTCHAAICRHARTPFCQTAENRQSLTIGPTIPVLLIALTPGSPSGLRPWRATARGDGRVSWRWHTPLAGRGRSNLGLRACCDARVAVAPLSQEATAMNRQYRKFWSLVLSAAMLAPGCAPQQPFYCREDGDLSHYLDVATEIEYPDVEEPSL